MFKRFALGLQLIGISWRLIRREPRLLWLPCISMLAIVFVGAMYLEGIASVVGVNAFDDKHWYLLAPLYFVTSYIGIVSNATLMTAVARRLDGKPLEIKRAFALVRPKLVQLLFWTVVTNSVGLLIRTVESRVPLLGRIVLAVAGFAWNAVSFLVVPTLVFEDSNVPTSINRSVSLFKARWGEQLAGQGAISIVFSSLTILAISFGLIVLLFNPWVGIAVLVSSLVVLLIVSTAMSSIFNVALYRVATDNPRIGAFGSPDASRAFQPVR